MVHSDAHTGNYMINYFGDQQFEQTVLDLDGAQRSWFIVDIGTVVWCANLSMFLHNVDDREAKLAQFKTWILDAYGWPTTEDELYQGCLWRHDFMYYILLQMWSGVSPTEQPWAWAGLLFDLVAYHLGLVPVC